MAANLLETIQINLGYPELQKIDPVTQMVIETDHTVQDRFSQAAIPAILTGLYKYVQTDAGATEFMQDTNTTNWMTKIFKDHKSEVIETIAAYAKQSDEDPVTKMNKIAIEAVKVVKEHLHRDSSLMELKVYFNNQKNDILLYLPPHLNIGELLNDGTLDDETHKMEGPVSSFIQSVGAIFSTPVNEKELAQNNNLK